MTETINIDFFDNSITPIIEAVKNDNTRQLRVVTKQDFRFFRMRLCGKLPNGEKVYKYGDYQSTLIAPQNDIVIYTFDITSDFTSQVGEVKLQLCFYTDTVEEDRISSFPITMKVYERGE